MKRVFEELTQASHKLAEAMYAKASQRSAEESGPQPTSNGQEQPGRKDDAVDADFEEVKG